MPDSDDILGVLDTGDLVLFSGTSTFSNLVKFATQGKWSHVGVVLRTLERPGEPLLWESTTLVDVPDVETGEARPGVQLVPLRVRVERYDGEVTCRRLNRPASGAMAAALAARRRDLARRGYEERELELLRAVYDGPGGLSPREALLTVYCAELVAEAYQAMGLLPEWPGGLPSNEYTPLDFCEERALALLGGYALGPEILLRAAPAGED
jgi:hypothetical protein